MDYGPPVDAGTKEERLRMLEREFGRKSKDNNYGDEDGYDNRKPTIGSVDQKGNLVTEGPKKRIALRFLEIILALAAAVPSIYAALVRSHCIRKSAF